MTSVKLRSLSIGKASQFSWPNGSRSRLTPAEPGVKRQEKLIFSSKSLSDIEIVLVLFIASCFSGFSR